MNHAPQRFRLVAALTLGLMLLAANAHALQEPEGAVKKKVADEAAPTKPLGVDRQVRFEAQEKKVTFKQRLEIYNRSREDNGKLYCREDRMTGSHRKQMRCITQAQKQDEEDAVRWFFGQP